MKVEHKKFLSTPCSSITFCNLECNIYASIILSRLYRSQCTLKTMSAWSRNFMHSLRKQRVPYNRIHNKHWLCKVSRVQEKEDGATHILSSRAVEQVYSNMHVSIQNGITFTQYLVNRLNRDESFIRDKKIYSCHVK